MTWMVWYNALMRYYPGLNLENIPKMTVWQFGQSVKNMGWLEQQAETEAEANMDEVFIKIREIYNESHFKAVHNVLTLSANDVKNYEAYLHSLNFLLQPVTGGIRQWINDNLVF